MNTIQTPVSKRLGAIARMRSLVLALIEPPADLEDSGLRRTARLLAIFLLILIGLFLLVDTTRLLTTPGYRPPWYGYVLFGGAYALTRVGADRAAASLTIAAFPLIIFTTIVNNPATGLRTIVHYLLLSVFLGSIFLPWRSLVTLAIANIAGLLSLPFALPAAIPGYASLVTPLAVNTIGAAIALVFLRHRDQLEGDRQAELRTSAERLRLALEAAHMGTWDWNVQTDLVTTSEQVAALFGVPANAIAAPAFAAPIATYVEHIHPSDRAVIVRDLAALLVGSGSDHRAEYRVLWPDGSYRWLEEQARVHRDPNGKPMRVTGTVLDITLRKQAETARYESEERYRVISELVSDYAFAYQVGADGSTTLEWITDAFTRITGYTVADIWTPEQLAAIIHPEDRPIATQRRRRQLAGQTDISEYRIIAKDGRTLWQRFYDRPVWDAQENRVVRLYGAVQDITQIKQLGQQLGQAQKMEAIGRLAGGIAHDFNNLLTVILGNAQLSLATPTDLQALQENAGQIQHAALRAAALTRQLLVFSRQQVLEPRLLDLNVLVETTGQMLRRLIGEDIELVMQLAPDLGQLKADAGQIEQVLVNLAVNGRDAMPTGGTLLITTANAEIRDPAMHPHIGTERGSYIVMKIADTGMGMDATTRSHIFEPFFTTKAPGKGTGLGLATVHGIVAQSSGYIHVDSAPGHGSTFSIYLPRVDAAEEPASGASLPALAPRGDGTILLVEDEPLLRGLAGRVLRRYGYHILEAADGPTALRLSATYAGSIDLLLTDLVMPGGISGGELAEQVVAQRTTIKVLYVSGYTDTAMTQRLLELGQPIVMKPFTPDELARTVGAILQA